MTALMWLDTLSALYNARVADNENAAPKVRVHCYGKAVAAGIIFG